MSNEPKPTCEICGDPMPAGEEMFKFHGYSGPCPKPPLIRDPQRTYALTHEQVERAKILVKEADRLQGLASVRIGRLSVDLLREVVGDD